MAEPEEAVVTAIGTTGGLSANTGVAPLFNGTIIRGPVRSTSDGAPAAPCCFVEEAGGEFNERFLGMTVNHRYHRVAVRIVGNIDDYPGAMGLARSVFSALDYASVSGYYSCRCVGAAPASLGYDAERRPIFAFYVQLRIVS